ncbi:hypothetical protein P8452_64272 [Trifolium repens]|nr:hypothetical protein P8452_64272 [Trifolium repens]
MRLEINEVLYYDDLIPTFHNLTQLELICHEYSWKFLVRVLSQCPKLQKLYFYQFDVDYETYDRNYDEENGVDPDVIPQSLLLNLRTCKFFDFFGLPENKEKTDDDML